MINGLKTYYTKITPNIFWSLASKGIAAIAFMLIDILLGRVLETELYGKWSQFFSLLTILLYITYSGVPAAAQSFAAQNRDLPRLKNVLKNSLVLQIGFSVIATGILLLIRNQIAGFVNHPEFATILLFAAPYLLIGALEEYFKNVFIGVKRTLYHFYMNVMSFGLRLIILIIITIFFRDIHAILYGYTAAMLISVITGLILYRKHYLGIIKSDIAQPIFYKKIFVYSLPLALSFFLVQSTPEINIQILGSLTNPTEVAYLNVGKLITSKLPQIGLAVAMGIMPNYTKITPENSAQKKKGFIGVLKMNLILYGLICGAIIMLSPMVIPLLYKASFAKAVLPLQIMTVNLFLGSLNIYFYMLLNYHGKASQMARLMFMTFVLNILFNFLLVPKYGAVGSALAITLAFLPYSILITLLGKKILEAKK